MKLTAEQYDAYIRDGFLVFPELFDEAEVNILRNEADRLRQIDAEGICLLYTSPSPRDS